MAPISSRPDPLIEKCYRPDLLGFMVALLLVKSNLQALSLRDYLSQLRGCIRESQRSNQKQASRHIDAVAYWRGALTETKANAKDTQVKLRARILELEKQLDRNNGTDGLASLPRSSSRKRRRVAMEPPEASNSTSQKRARTKSTATALSRHGEQLATLVRDIEGSSCHAQGHPFLEHLYQLQEASFERKHDLRQLATALCHASTGINQLIASFDYPKDPQHACAATAPRSTRFRSQTVSTNTSDTFPHSNRNNLRVVSTSFPCLLNGLRNLDALPDSRIFRGRVIWSFVKVFEGLLERICDLSEVQVSGEIVPLQPTRVTSQPTSYTPAPESVLRLCELAVTLIKVLDTTKATDLEVLEGFIFLLLQRVGRGLSRFVFGIEEVEVPKEQRLASMHATFPGKSEHGIAANQKVMEAQAPSLIWILERVWATAAKLNPSSENRQTSDSFTTGSTPTSSTTALSMVARHRLQHTLVAAVFGDQVRADFQSALNPASTPIEEEMSAQFTEEMEDHGVEDWYKHKVWRLIGWDVLKGHLGNLS